MGSTNEEDVEPVDLATEVHLSSKDLIQIPSEITDNRCLTHVYLDYNDVDHLPTDFGIFLPNLEFLSMIGNRLRTLPQSIGNLFLIRELYLNENDMVQLPDTFCRLNKLIKLKLTGNSLEYLPEDFGELTSLEELEVDENGLKRLPKTLGLLENLKLLELGCNSIESLSDGIGQLKSLEVLNLSSNMLTVLPESFGDLPSLRRIDISANEIKFLPTRCRFVHCLEKLYADSNLLQSIPDWASRLVNITEFSLKDNQFQHQAISDEFPKGCRNLKILDIAGNFMSALPECLGDLLNLEYLHLGSVIGELERRNFQNGNWLADIPCSLCHLEHLRELHLDENQIMELPKEFGNLKSLEVFDIGQNLLHDLPESFGCLPSLRICMLSKNHLQWLPSNFGNLSTLEDIRLDDNELAELPESFCRLSRLKTLDLFSNRLREIPSALHHLTSLVRLDLEANDFQVPLSDIPQIVTKSKYPARDPTLKDNWRGKARQDITNMDSEIVTVEENDCNFDFEPPPPSLNLNEDCLSRAMMQNLSIWRSHSDTSPRRRSRRRRHRSYPSQEDGEREDDGEQMEDGGDGDDDGGSGDSDEEDDDNEFEPPIFRKVTTWSGSKTTHEPSQDATQAMIQSALEEVEDWDLEVESTDIYETKPVYSHPVWRYYPPTENGAFTFAPHDMHLDSYVKTPRNFPKEEGQFENSDSDGTNQTYSDPVF